MVESSAARPIQLYLLHLFGASILSLYAGLDYHQESRACVMDYCDKPTDIEAAIANGDLCSHCMQVIDRAVSENRISLAEFERRESCSHARRDRSAPS
ncbi:MAG: hypothetical protein U0132_02135 [Gemmatimonadaceae bacterium]